MGKSVWLLVAVLLVVGAVVVGGRAPQASGAGTDKILDLDTMVGIPRRTPAPRTRSGA